MPALRRLLRLFGQLARFTLEDDAALDLIPADFVNARQSGMKCEGDRCSALTGKIGEHTACGIYDIRPDVCRACQPGDPECAMARRKFGLPVLSAPDRQEGFG